MKIFICLLMLTVVSVSFAQMHLYPVCPFGCVDLCGVAGCQYYKQVKR